MWEHSIVSTMAKHIIGHASSKTVSCTDPSSKISSTLIHTNIYVLEIIPSEFTSELCQSSPLDKAMKPHCINQDYSAAAEARFAWQIIPCSSGPP